MPVSSHAIDFEISSGKYRDSAKSRAALTLTHSRYFNGQYGWKAVIRVRGDSKRIFGLWRYSMVVAAEVALERIVHRISDTEKSRILQRVADMEAGRPSVMDSQPKDASEPMAPALSQANGRRNGVHAVHQIYGLFRDDEPMSPLFQSSHRGWSDVAASMGADYHLWDADEVESLVKQRYPQFWDLYCGVRYPIMRCDMARLCILHCYGGLYADLDTLPNRDLYEPAELAVARVRVPSVPTQKMGGVGWDVEKAKELAASGALSLFHGSPKPPGYGATKPKTVLEMEVIIGSKGNAIFLRWLEHMAQEIRGKDYGDKSSFWFNARMRYVYNTTGPMSMARFFRLPANAEDMRTMKYLECNWFPEAYQLTALQRRCFDVISHESNSYFTTSHEIRVAVGEGDTMLPPQPIALRMYGKCAARRWRTGKPDTASSSCEQSRECEQQCAMPHGDPDMERLDREFRQDTDRKNELKDFFRRYKRCASTKVLLDEMSEELRAWLTSDSP